MAHEFLFDISENTYKSMHDTWLQTHRQENCFIGSIYKCSEDLNLRPLWNLVIRGAVEDSDSQDTATLRLLGSFSVLDAVVDEMSQREEVLIVTEEDIANYRKFANKCLVEPRWREVYENGDVIDVEKFIELVQKFGRPVADITPLADLLMENGHALLHLVRYYADSLASSFPKELQSEVNIQFMRGAWIPISILAVKFSGEELLSAIQTKQVRGSNLN